MIQEKFDLFLDGWKLAIRGALEPSQEFFGIFSNMWLSLLVVSIFFMALLTYCLLRGREDFKRRMKNPRVLTICALMIALNIVLGFFQINFSAYLRVGFGFLTQPIIAMLFGPLTCCATGMIQDILSYILHPTGAYVPAYTICVGISGMLHGLILYQKPVTLRRNLLDKTIVILIGNILLNSIALAPTVGSGFIGILPSRILKNLLLLPIQTVICYFILKLVKRQKSLENI